MQVEESQRITYAQKKLRELVEKRQLRSWCEENNLEHSAIYRIAMGSQIPTYKIISSMVDLIPPAEWLYFTDEIIPYEVRTVSKWDSNQICIFLLKNRKSYRELAAKYDIPVSIAQNIFVHYRTKMSLAMMRKFAEVVDPVEFFITDSSMAEEYVPEKGDIIRLSGKSWLVLSNKDFNKQNSAVFCVKLIEDSDSKQIEDQIDKLGFTTLSYSRIHPEFVNKIELSVIKIIMQNFNKYF